MIARQQRLQINEIPPRLQPISPDEPRIVRHRITPLCSESESQARHSANFFTRSKAGDPVTTERFERKGVEKRDRR
jgi:hypothetical protein